MKRTILVFILFNFLSFRFGYAQTNPFAKLRYDKVIAYEYQPEEEENIIDDNGKLAKQIFTKTTLTPDQIRSFQAIITAHATYGGETAACFQPHMGVVYYVGNKVVAHVSICMACNFLQESKNITIPETTYDHKIINGESIPLVGFSKEGRKKLRDFTNTLHFKQDYHKSYSPYDE